MKIRYLHWVMAGKGGCGKTVVARLLLESMICAGYKARGIDVEPLNATFAEYQGLPVEYIKTTVDGGRKIDEVKFDTVLNNLQADKESEHVVIDCGSGNFGDLMDYLGLLRVLEITEGMGYRNVGHMLFPGGGACQMSFNLNEELLGGLGDQPITCVAWHNQHFGPLVVDGEAIETNQRWLAMREKLAAQMTLEKYRPDGLGYALNIVLEDKTTFDEAIASTDSMILKARFSILRDRLLPTIQSMVEYVGEVHEETLKVGGMDDDKEQA